MLKGRRLKTTSALCLQHGPSALRDDKGVRGPVEEALVGTPVLNAEKPLEVLRVVHSFDPCLACTVHVIHPESNRIMEFKVS